ncbi:MAG: hypothetical protein ACLFPX_07575 [Candidatus Omnitrophota bacterium]
MKMTFIVLSVLMFAGAFLAVSSAEAFIPYQNRLLSKGEFEIRPRTFARFLREYQLHQEADQQQSTLRSEGIKVACGSKDKDVPEDKES